MFDEAIYLLKSHNYKITKQRRSLIECLYNNCRDHYIDVTKIDKKMRKLYPNMSHNTIYRNIKEFQDIGIIEFQNNSGLSRVKYQCDFENIHHHHFICRKCGLVKEVKECSLDVFAEQLPGYKIEEHHFELHGLCDKCLKEKNENQAI